MGNCKKHSTLLTVYKENLVIEPRDEDAVRCRVGAQGTRAFS
jgi:hypothetical protein